MSRIGSVGLILSAIVIAPVGLDAQEYPFLADTRHDLAINQYPASPEDVDRSRCVFCHLPQGYAMMPGLWNETGPDFLLDHPYDRPSTETPAGKPDGASLVCLGCHDGTIALGDILSGSRAGVTNNGFDRTDLFDGHPVSLPYQADTAGGGDVLRSAGALPDEIQLDDDGKLQCTTCHDPHDDRFGQFLVVEDRTTGLCIACHNKETWDASPHNTAAATWNRGAPDPWPFTDSTGTVADHGCANCHTPHTAGSGNYLLNFAPEEENCLSCHNGNVARTDLQSEFNKVSRHPIEFATGVHNADEAVVIPPSSRHVECVDCHDPHSTRIAAADGEFAGSLNLRGMDVNGGELTAVTAEFEICYRCHGDGPAGRAMPTPRVHDQTNVRLQFDTGNPSFHPVVAPGNNANVPSLIAPLVENSTIGCVDCHSSDADSRLGGPGPDGPHGSIYTSLLVREYQTRDRTPESPSAYALCYDCHDRTSILADESFPAHNQHVVGLQTPCSACHDPHGISLTQGNTTENTHLINFDTSIVTPGVGGDLRFEDRGSQAGACYLSCHNRDHDGLSY